MLIWTFWELTLGVWQWQALLILCHFWYYVIMPANSSGVCSRKWPLFFWVILKVRKIAGNLDHIVRFSISVAWKFNGPWGKNLNCEDAVIIFVYCNNVNKYSYDSVRFFLCFLLLLGINSVCFSWIWKKRRKHITTYFIFKNLSIVDIQHYISFRYTAWFNLFFGCATRYVEP